MITQADTLRSDIKRLEMLLTSATRDNDIALEREIYHRLDIAKSTLINIM
mgnify:CR=1 FL=1|tara:strand:+ start:343 stop:492 length:150 start_codon:yes stop_codon:yes gene_type:complete